MRLARKYTKSADDRKHSVVVNAHLPNEPNASGVFPKPHKPGKRRQIVGLLSRKVSVNDSVEHCSKIQTKNSAKEHCSIPTYPPDVGADTVSHGRGSLLAKADVKEAFHTARGPSCHAATRYAVEGQIIIFHSLHKFGLLPAPNHFTAVADALKRIVRRQGGPHIFHHVGDNSREISVASRGIARNLVLTAVTVGKT